MINVGRDSDQQKDTLVLVLSPNKVLTKSLQKNAKDYEGAKNHDLINENSLVLRIGYENVHFLLTGDMSLSGDKYADYTMMYDPVQSKHLSVDVLKLGHNGFNAPDDSFYQNVRPQVVIMTFGPKLLPGKEMECEGLGGGMENLQYYKGKLWSTCLKGNIIVTTSGSKDCIQVSSKLGSVPGGCRCNCKKRMPM